MQLDSFKLLYGYFFCLSEFEAEISKVNYYSILCCNTHFPGEVA